MTDKTEVQQQEFPPYPFVLYQAQAIRTAKELDEGGNLMHAALGLQDEVGEFSKIVKRSFVYDAPFDVENAIEELGDILWFVSLACHALKIPMDLPAVRNIEKLFARFPEAYSNEDAIARADKGGEETES